MRDESQQQPEPGARDTRELRVSVRQALIDEIDVFADEGGINRRQWLFLAVNERLERQREAQALKVKAA